MKLKNKEMGVVVNTSPTQELDIKIFPPLKLETALQGNPYIRGLLGNSLYSHYSALYRIMRQAELLGVCVCVSFFVNAFICLLLTEYISGHASTIQKHHSICS